MIGIICAMSEERDALLKLMSGLQIKKGKTLHYRDGTLDNEYYEGMIGGKKVVVTRCGVGTVYAGLCTAELIREYDPDLIINLGVAGSLSDKVHVSDIVVADICANWRVDVPGWDRKFGTIENTFSCSADFCDAVRSMNIENVHVGPLVSSDEFIYRPDQLAVIKQFYPEALCGEMEACSICNTCFAYGTDCAVIRSISDETLVSSNFTSYEFNLLHACDRAAELCVQVLERL